MALTRVYLEVGAKRTFAMALDWPGWGRSGRTDDEALEALADYAARYAPVAKKAGLTVDTSFEVVESLPGNATTDFGAPAAFATADSEPVPAAAAKRTAALVEACWDTLTRVAARSPEELRKGPRGGGRDRDKMLTHVIETEAAYGRKIGVSTSRRRSTTRPRSRPCGPTSSPCSGRRRTGRCRCRRDGRLRTRRAASRGTRSTTRGRCRTVAPRPPPTPDPASA